MPSTDFTFCFLFDTNLTRLVKTQHGWWHHQQCRNTTFDVPQAEDPGRLQQHGNQAVRRSSGNVRNGMGLSWSSVSTDYCRVRSNVRTIVWCKCKTLHSWTISWYLHLHLFNVCRTGRAILLVAKRTSASIVVDVTRNPVLPAVSAGCLCTARPQCRGPAYTR
jgi:hypothetical protein